MQAAMGCEQLIKFPEFAERRRANWKKLRLGLNCLSKKLILPEPEPNSDPCWFGFLITVKSDSGIEREDLIRYLEKNNIQTRMLFAGNIIKHPCFDEMRISGKGYRVVGDLTNTDIIMNQTFWIGVYPGMTDDMIDYMIDKITEYVGISNDKNIYR